MSNSQKEAYEEAIKIEAELDACIAADLANDVKVDRCRALSKQLGSAFDGWQSPVSSKISNPLHWKISDFIVSITNECGKAKG